MPCRLPPKFRKLLPKNFFILWHAKDERNPTAVPKAKPVPHNLLNMQGRLAAHRPARESLRLYVTSQIPSLNPNVPERDSPRPIRRFSARHATATTLLYVSAKFDAVASRKFFFERRATQSERVHAGRRNPRKGNRSPWPLKQSH